MNRSGKPRFPRTPSCVGTRPRGNDPGACPDGPPVENEGPRASATAQEHEHPEQLPAPNAGGGKTSRHAKNARQEERSPLKRVVLGDCDGAQRPKRNGCPSGQQRKNEPAGHRGRWKDNQTNSSSTAAAANKNGRCDINRTGRESRLGLAPWTAQDQELGSPGS